MNVEHQTEQQCFVIAMNGETAVMSYRYINADTIDFDHTFVPDAFRGQGVAAELFNAGVAWAQQQGYHMQASCSYARVMLKRMKLI